MLVKHQNVSVSATKLGMTQPGMSIALAKLRKILGDPILVPVGGRMVATEHAQYLLPQVHEILLRTRALSDKASAFEPKCSTVHFAVALMESVASLVMPEIVQRLAQEAPHARLTCRASNHEKIEDWFDQGEIHLGIGYHPRPPGHLHARVLFEDSWALLVAQSHPMGRRPSVGTLLKTPWLKICPAASDIYWDLVIAALAQAGCQPIVGACVPSFLVAAHIVAKTNMVAAMPMRLARSLATQMQLRALPLPLKLPPLAFGMRWHPRTHAATEHSWFRALAMECSNSVMAIPG